MSTTKATSNEVDTSIVTSRLSSKIITATRDLTAASGDVSYTGVGFTPTAIMIIAAIQNTTKINVAMADSSKTLTGLYAYANNGFFIDALVDFEIDGLNKQTFIIKSYDADGFTLTWTKTGSPTGTASLKFLCFR